jgi:hypothetical protein
VPLKHERMCSSMYHSRADKAAAASVTPAGVISCAQAEHREPACAAQVREQEQQHVSQPSRCSRGGERHACYSDQLQSRRHACYSDELRTSRAASANLSSECQEPVLLKHESKSGIMYRSRADEAAAASATPGMEISCARAEQRAQAPAYAA